MTEPEIINQYVITRTNAALVGLELTTTHAEFVLRDVTQNQQEFARCSTLAGVKEALNRREKVLRQP